MRIAYLALIELDIPNACLIHTKEITEQMVELGHDVELFLPLPLKKQSWNITRHYWIRFWGFDSLRRSFFLFEACFKIWQAHRMKAFDCLYLREMENANVLMRFCQFLKLPFFVEVNGWLLDDLRLMDASHGMLKKAELNQKKLMQSACGVIASTLGNRDNVKKHYQVQHVITQELGVNADLFAAIKKMEAREYLKLSQHKPMILFAGSFHPHHDLKTLIQAFAYMKIEMPEAQLLLVGDGAQYQIAQTWVGDLSVEDSVIFMGSQPYEAMPYWFSAANLLVSPLIAQKIQQQNGALATKVWEAMAANTAVLVTDVNTSKSFALLSKLAWVCRPECAEAMSATMVSALNEPDERVKKAQSYVLAERSWRKAASDTIDFMKKCLKDCSSCVA